MLVQKIVEGRRRSLLFSGYLTYRTAIGAKDTHAVYHKKVNDRGASEQGHGVPVVGLPRSGERTDENWFEVVRNGSRWFEYGS